EQVFKKYGKKVEKIYNGYEFDEIRRKSNEEEKEFCDIISIGRLDKNKNISLLIDAVYRLKDKLPNVKVNILGDGEERKELERKVKEFNLEDNVKFKGYINNPYPYIKNSKVLSVTSYVEGFPTVIVEAMSLGCTFVSTDIGGAEELSDNGTCGIIIKRDSKELSEKLYEILTDDKMREKMKLSSIKNASKYSIDNQIRLLKEIMD
ncbi:glycosyltransferase, partial [Clostridium sp.]|uniref:glycosyltransferase n=1 Tax=Clostridium sp. TaxID=1506 RepID=UPI0034649324